MNTASAHSSRFSLHSSPAGALRFAEDGLAAIALLVMAALPVGDLVLRTLTDHGIPGAVEYTQHLSLWVGFLGAIVAARTGQHISLARKDPADDTTTGSLESVVAVISCTVSLLLAWASFQFVASELHSPTLVGGVIPTWMVELVLPIAFAAIALHVVKCSSITSTIVHFTTSAMLAAIFLAVPVYLSSWIVWPLAAMLIASAFIGVPIFVMLGGLALLLFYAADIPSAALPVETFRLVVSPTIPAIPLFTLTGFILSSGRAGERLVQLFQAWLGWLPGGTVIATTLVCAFFSAFTGASGVTILALGGLLLPALIAGGSDRRLSLGLVTSTGSIGLLFPPSLAVILYAVVARVPISDLFRAGLVPGLLMVAAVCTYGLLRTRAGSAVKQPFSLARALRCTWQSKWELALPAIVLTAIFGGFMSLIEAAAVSACYALFVESVIHRGRGFAKLSSVFIECATLLGGVFAIIGVAMGLTNYLVDAMVPMKVLAWVQAHVEARWVFLLALNITLLVAGCLMDIFSAIFVVLPLIIPASLVFGIDPLHLGVIFLINLELGYLTPPVGMNLFLSAYRLRQPLPEVYRSVLPYLVVLLAVLLVVTYAPQLLPGLHQ